MDKKSGLSPMGLGLALGVTWGLAVIIIGLAATFLSFGVPFVATVGHVYVGYEVGVIGTLIGALIAFVHAFIIGVVVAAFYNVFSGCCQNR